MRVLHVVNRYWPAPGGAERHSREYAERQAAEGHDVVVFTTNALDLEYYWDPRKRSLSRPSERHNGVRIERFPVVHLPPPGVGFRAARRLLGEIDRLPGTSPLLRLLSPFAPLVPGLALALRRTTGRFDVVHGMNIAFESLLWPALSHARSARVPFLISPLFHLGESEDSVVRRYYTMKHQVDLVRRADMVLTQTPTEARFLARRGISVARMTTAGAGVGPAEAIGGDAQRFRTRHGIAGPIVFSIGAMAFDKGTFHLVEAMERLWTTGLGADLVLAGPTMDQFVRFMSERPEWVRRRVRVLGYLDDEAKRDLLAAGDILAMPSRTDSFGIVYLEAWLAGNAVIAAEAGGVPDVVQHEHSGLIVPFGDVGALARAIERLLGDPVLRRRLAEHGARVTRECHTWDAVYARVRPVFERATERTAASNSASTRSQR